MTRLARCAFIAVFVATLSLSTQAAAMPFAAAPRLDTTRVFDPASESLFAVLSGAPALDSLVTLAAFGAQNPETPSADVAQILANENGSRASFTLPLVGIRPLWQPAPFAASTALAAGPIAFPHKVATLSARLYAPNIAVVGDAPIEALSNLAPDPSAPPFVSYAGLNDQTVHFGTYEPYVPAIEDISANVTVPVRVGPVRFAGTFAGTRMQTLHPDAFREMQICGTTEAAAPCPYLTDSHAERFTAGTNFNVRAGNERLSLQLSGSVEHLSRSDTATFPYVPVDPDPGIDDSRPAGADLAAPLLYYPGVTDLVKHGVNASLAVPLTHRVTLGLQYDTQHYQGAYGSALATGIDAHKETYLGNLTYQLPNTSSAITFSARQYRYQDTFTPNYNLTQTRADLDFTVKF